MGYLTAFLNSKLFRFCFRDYFPELLGESRELRKVFFETIPVKPSIDEDWFTKCVSEIQKSKSQSVATINLENDVEKRIWDYYDLSEKDRKIIADFS